jgi:hypothetical protein
MDKSKVGPSHPKWTLTGIKVLSCFLPVGRARVRRLTNPPI